jgi:hypothetical protein
MSRRQDGRQCIQISVSASRHPDKRQGVTPLVKASIGVKVWVKIGVKMWVKASHHWSRRQHVGQSVKTCAPSRMTTCQRRIFKCCSCIEGNSNIHSSGGLASRVQSTSSGKTQPCPLHRQSYWQDCSYFPPRQHRMYFSQKHG